MDADPRRTPSRRRRAALWLALFAVAGGVFLAVATPVKILMPFAPQSPSDLDLALFLRTWSPTIAIAGVLAVLALGVMLWHGMRWWGMTAFVIVAAFVGFVTWFAHQNHFEWMFRPVAETAFVPASDADFVGEDERVLAVKVGDDAAAYPIRQIAYHHVVHDTVGGTPVAVTY
jgi:hypothetical protein